ncbi:MAG: radical SAM/SPASM domain-containing protein [Chloroflexi bacterium]|nr:MAG: radical SAM/SPASM domain-containing protein [Chloroflexota bacterium]MBL1193673.1 radical SAM/SPASM domain-containing protein [Chloroflexota bacterium]NOH10965.1 radical SAM protein [Chloroflexota bacterium]
MAGFLDSLRQRFSSERAEKLPSGIYHYQSPPDDPLNYRLHLRLEGDGSGLLVINASTVLHLNQTAAEYAYHLVQRTPADQVAEQVSKRYRVRPGMALADFEGLQERIETLITTPDLDPVTYLDFERHEPYSDAVTAPYRLDCALTYRLPEHAPPGMAPDKRVDRELTTEEWKQVIDKAWEVGIPHIIFTGGEPTLRDDLAELIKYAEDKGQVTGLLTNGLRLADTSYLNELLQAGLDHAMVILQPNDQQTWESLASFAYWTETLEEDIFIAAHLTITQENAKQVFELMDKLAEGGVSAVSLSESEPSLSETLQEARSYADSRDLPLIWDLPVPYSNMNPVALELEAEEQPLPEGSGIGWLYVEPDGDVLPGQGINEIVGNILKNDWKDIWEATQRFIK